MGHHRKTSHKGKDIITSLDLDPAAQERFNLKLIAKYNEIREKEVRYEEFQCDDAEYLLVAYGTSARVCQKSVQLARKEGFKVGLLRRSPFSRSVKKNRRTCRKQE